MEKRELTCIGCPMGCPLTVELENGAVTAVYGNTCPRGDAYARKEVTAPTRIVTTTVRVTGGVLAAVSCKTQTDIPKDKIFAVVRDRGRPGDHRAGRAAQRRRHRRGCDRHKKCGSKVSEEAPSVRGLLSFRCSQALCYENNFPEKVKYFKNFGQKSTVCLNNAQKNCRFFSFSTILLKTLSFL